MKKVKWKTLTVSLPVGQINNEKLITLEKGELIVAAAATNYDPKQIVKLGLYENGNEISTPVSLDFWKRSNAGQYLDGFKPIEYKGGSEVTAKIFTSEPLAGESDLAVEVVFGIVKEDTTC